MTVHDSSWQVLTGDRCERETKRDKNHFTKSMPEKAWHKKHDTKSITEKAWHKKHVRKSMTEKVWQKKHDSKSITEKAFTKVESCFVNIR